ncbi:NAD/NADP octopine/nopaline dehydrogenase family protein [Pseudotabrizicola alkalilacus]|uniref:2-dehydropantoate 2-reductase n=1 Tax=Pseudotabrizicola alkalilacus TaxID=2305252 RepID=A0A411Z078_9RHOB|nr:NAD/NADP octopine/nopaline dehydrogenase family protein [Pseudotabrizicola alkalilacus]RGP36452.1 NAD/NADP octopine/nopaline dehydrogenase [Pseudotabrizicola alkalilacus]
MAATHEKLTVGIAGAGAVAFATAACLEDAGHRAILWSPSGKSTARLAAGEALTATGALEGAFHPGVAASAQDLVAASDVVLVALPGYGHKTVLDAIAPHLRDGQPVIISSHASFGALYLLRQVAQRGVRLPVTVWGTTLATARQPDLATVSVNTIRSKIDVATVPVSESAKGLALCQTLFGDRFVPREDVLAISLSNLNPQNHMGIALCNMTRMEHGETWSQGGNVTPNVGRLMEALDAERVAIATALGLKVRTIFEHYHLSYHVPVAPIAEMNAELHAKGIGGQGPATADSRYVTEDVPYGLAVTAALGKMAGHPAVLHQSGVALFSAMYGRDFLAENTLLSEIGLDRLSLDQLRQACTDGTLPTTEKTGT